MDFNSKQVPFKEPDTCDSNPTTSKMIERCLQSELNHVKLRLGTCEHSPLKKEFLEHNQLGKNQPPFSQHSSFQIEEAKNSTSRNNPIINIFIQSWNSSSLSLIINASDMTIKKLILSIAKRVCIPPHELRLVYCGKELHNLLEATLKDIGIVNNSVIFLHLRLRGGGGFNDRNKTLSGNAYMILLWK